MKLDQNTFRLTDKGKLGSVSLVIGLIGLAATSLGYFTDTKQFYHSYLVAFAFWVSIGLGGLFFTMLHHLVNAEWSTVLRRWSESVAATLPLMAVFAIPVLLGMGELYHWSHVEVVANDAILTQKAPYLNPTFFVIRSIGYFVIWSILALSLYRTSLKQDSGHSASLTQRFRRISAPGMILFALTLSFASFDWLMSLDAHWYSTIFGVYFFTGSLLAVLSFMVLIGIHLRRRSVLNEVVTIEHYHDLGKLLFGFIIFWAYMGFSQYMLIWYANIPEETIWFHHRWYSGWRWVSLLMIFGHFVLPFVVLITRASKRNLIVLGSMAVWVLLMRWVDLHWLVFPTLHEHSPHLSWMDLTSIVGVGGIFVWYFWRKYSSHPVIPMGDPSLKNSMKFENT
ncbi:MAG: hypothetical protein OEV49_00160 [candidate division Zixibacteria bacterium]|nr:hypothetical protein [candidate division Zixibacteria bacterium]MDH3938195.1 hypothetical protein [candidate division Zixibacteria bacterium]MDH4034323.1 hypothetical protein [candidate division Zixibacteria bacterium]